MSEEEAAPVSDTAPDETSDQTTTGQQEDEQRRQGNDEQPQEDDEQLQEAANEQSKDLHIATSYTSPTVLTFRRDWGYFRAARRASREECSRRRK